MATRGLSVSTHPVWPALDWRQPWLQDWRELGERVEQRLLQGLPVFEALNQEEGSPVRFVPQQELRAGQAYEDFIFQTRCCPTRDGLHDFFNGLCWLQFPQTKLRLNLLQAEQIARAGIGAVRGPVRDAITVFDENAAFFIGPTLLWEALRQRDWQRLFVRERALWSQARLVLFGHALLEKLVSPRKAITAHVIRVESDGDALAQLDERVAQDLSADQLAAKPFVPMPVSGVPRWWPGNDDASFYDDAQVFRPARNG